MNNFKHALTVVAKNTGLSTTFLLDNELVVEIEAEDGEGFQTYVDGESNYIKAGTPVGVEISDGSSTTFELYVGVYYE